MAALRDFEAVIDKAIKDSVIPGVVLAAKNKTGSLSYLHAAGLSSLSPPSPMLPSTVFTLASGSKLLTTIAVLQLVERGQLSLDSDMTPYLPQPTPSPSSPSSAAPAIPTTLRHLLTHTSGLAYPFLNPRVAALKAAALGTPDPFAGATLHERYGYPPAASSQPGTQFQMGPSIDFAGSALERVTGTDLDSYFVEHLLAPLGIAPGAGQMTFFPQRVVAGGLVDGGPGGSFAGVAVRDEETGRLRAAGDEKVGKAYLASEEAFGGEGAYASAPAYAAVLESLLRDDGRLLRPATAAAMFEPQLPGAEARRSLNELLVRPDWVVGPVPPGEYDWGLGGLLWLGGKGDRGGHRRRGMMGWGGMFNMTWFIDREAGVCAVFGTQVLPVRDPLVNKLHEQFEEAVYAAANELQQE